MKVRQHGAQLTEAVVRRDPSARIAAHLGRMLGGTIAAVTAFTVVNVRIEPAFVVWLAPTVVLTPVIAYWTARVRGGRVSTPATVADSHSRQL
jgi:hypothetical protein